MLVPHFGGVTGVTGVNGTETHARETDNGHHVHDPPDHEH